MTAGPIPPQPGMAPGMMPGAPAPGMAPGVAGAPPPGMMPGMAGPMAPPPMPPAPAPSFFTDLSPDLPIEWQLIDVMIRTGNDALATGNFRKNPPVDAAIRSVVAQLSRLLSAYASGGSGALSGAPASADGRGALGDSSPINDSSDSDGGDAAE